MSKSLLRSVLSIVGWFPHEADACFFLPGAPNLSPGALGTSLLVLGLTVTILVSALSFVTTTGPSWIPEVLPLGPRASCCSWFLCIASLWLSEGGLKGCWEVVDSASCMTQPSLPGLAIDRKGMIPHRNPILCLVVDHPPVTQIAGFCLHRVTQVLVSGNFPMSSSLNAAATQSPHSPMHLLQCLCMVREAFVWILCFEWRDYISIQGNIFFMAHGRILSF